MSDKTTGELISELMSDTGIDSYISGNELHFCDRSISELLTALYDRGNISKASLARKAGMSEVYLHQVFSGRRKPSRDRLLCICISLGATLEETQQMLKRAAYAQMYVKIKRDAIISYGIVHRVPLVKLNEKLFAENEKTLF